MEHVYLSLTILAVRFNEMVSKIQVLCKNEVVEIYRVLGRNTFIYIYTMIFNGSSGTKFSSSVFGDNHA